MKSLVLSLVCLLCLSTVSEAHGFGRGRLIGGPRVVVGRQQVIVGHSFAAPQVIVGSSAVVSPGAQQIRLGPFGRVRTITNF